jgi:hypothetical protein
VIGDHLDRILFVTPHALSSGEAITALHAAHQAEERGATVRFAASARTARFLRSRFPADVTEFSNDCRANGRLLDEVIAGFTPQVVVFADYSLLHPHTGGIPLVDDEWVGRLDGWDADLVTFDHLGLEQPTAAAARLRRIEQPARLKVLLPCPMHDPAPVSGRRGIPFRHYERRRHADTEAVRAAFGPPSGGYLILHTVSSWAWQMAEVEDCPFYQVLPGILESYFADLPLPVSIVSVNRGDLLPAAPKGRIRVTNLPPLPVDRFEALMGAADLVMTENCYSSGLGKAICADVPAMSWRNSFELGELLSRLTGEDPAAVLETALNHPEVVTPWVAFPWWSPDVQQGLSVLEQNDIAGAFLRLEIFGGQSTAQTIRRQFVDDEFRDGLTQARRVYASSVSRLPDCYDAICRAVSASV